MPRGPACRARHLKGLLASADRLGPPAAPRIRTALPPEDLRAIDDATGVEWLDMATNLRVTRAIHDALGPEAFHRFIREHFGGAFHGPLYRAFIEGATALFGLDPGSWMRLLPETWSTTYKNCGRWTVERREPGRVALTLSEVPSICLTDRAWPLAVAAALSATIDRAGCEGAVEVASIEQRAGEARFEMRWTPKK